jgi:FkbM family methyltransferase
MKRWLRDDLPWHVGKLVKRLGRAPLGGCWFDVSGDVLTTYHAGLLALGRYERAEREAVRRFVDRRASVIELGASMGVLSCLTNRKLDSPARHVVVEPNPHALNLLRANKRLNGSGFTIRPGALAYRESGFVDVDVEEDLLLSRADSGRGTRVSVPAVTLKAALLDLRHTGAGEAYTLICDIEGAEIALLTNEAETIAQGATLIIIETHETDGLSTTAFVDAWMREHNYASIWGSSMTHVYATQAGRTSFPT